MNEKELYQLRSRVFHKLLKFNNEEQCRAHIAFAEKCGKDEIVFVKLEEYIDNPRTKKTFDKIEDFIEKYDDEFQQRNNLKIKSK